MSDFNQKEYIKQYDKEHYKQFKCKVKIKEMERINKLLKEHNMSKHDLVNFGVNVLESEMPLLIKYEKEYEERKKRDKALDNIFEYVGLNDVTIEQARGYIIKEIDKIYND